jgi:hypothetical protein
MLAPDQRAWLIGLLALWFGLLYGGFVLGKPDLQGDRRMPLWTRMSSSAVLVLAAWSWVYIAICTDAKTYAVLVAAGMSLGFLGDLVLAQTIPIVGRVAAGMAFFGLGHTAYILAFSGFSSNYPIRWSPMLIIAYVGWVTIGIMGWRLVVCRGSQRTRLSRVTLVYSFLLAGMAALATTLALQDSDFIPTAVGASLFVVSDTILAAVLFNTCRIRLVHDVIWLTYGPAQMLIVYSIFAAIRAVT